MQRSSNLAFLHRSSRRLTAALSAMVAVTCGLGSAFAQSAFAPPPPPPNQNASAAAASTTPLTTKPPTNASLDVTPTTPNQSASTGAQPIEGGQIVARVDGQIILASDVLWQVDQLIQANLDRIPPDKIQEARQGILRQQVMQLLDTKMLYAHFRRQVPPENIPQIEENLRQPFEEQEVPRLVKMLKLKDRNELIALLESSGTSLADVRRQFAERTIASEWLRQMIPKPKEATHDEMLDYYNEHKKDFEFPSQAKWEEVVIRFDRVGNDRTAAWQAITGIGNEVWQRVRQQPNLRGAVFTEIAKAKSHGFTAQEGGQHDWTTKGALRNEDINHALFTLRVGQLSNVIESEVGFHIIRVLDRKVAGCTPFTEAQGTIREALERDQRDGLAEAELMKLRKKSRVWTLFDGYLDRAELAERRQNQRQR